MDLSEKKLALQIAQNYKIFNFVLPLDFFLKEVREAHEESTNSAGAKTSYIAKDLKRALELERISREFRIMEFDHKKAYCALRLFEVELAPILEQLVNEELTETSQIFDKIYKKAIDSVFDWDNKTLDDFVERIFALAQLNGYYD